MATSFQKTGDPRQAHIIDTIKERKIRFPVAELSKKLGIPSGNVSEILNGKRAPSEAFYRKFCEVYGDPVESGPFEKDDPLNWERAAIKALSWGLANALSEISELKGKPRDPESYLEEIDRSTNMILSDLRRSGKDKVQ